MDLLSELPIDLFIKEITYLPFDEVVSVCNLNIKTRNYCTNSRYNNNWKLLIDNTFLGIENYQDKLKNIWSKLNYQPEVYNYLVYTQLVKYLDPVTQGMIYYRQGDIISFDNLTKEAQFLSLFLLNNKNIKEYLPMKDKEDIYQSFVDILNNKQIPNEMLRKMLLEMTTNGSLQGIKYLGKLGVNIHDQIGAMIVSSEAGHLDVVKYLVEQGADVNVLDDRSLRWASKYGHLDVVKYLIEHGANIHAEDDYALRWASNNGHLEVVKYLIEKGADVHGNDDDALRSASYNGHLEVVKYLVEKGVNIHTDDDYALKWASERGHLEVVKYLIEKGADVHSGDDYALRWASMNGHLDVVKYLVEQGADVHAMDDRAFRYASERGHLDVVKYLIEHKN